MSTTAIIVELLIVGLFSAVWIFLFCLRLTVFTVDDIKTIIPQMSTWSAPLLFVAVATLYQLGIFLNALSDSLTRVVVLGMRKQMFSDQEYEYVRTVVYQKGADELVSDVKLLFSFIRLSRSGVVNFCLIAVAIFLFGGRIALFGFVPLFVAVYCISLYRGMTEIYYLRLKIAYQVIAESSSSDALAKTAPAISDPAPNSSLHRSAG